MEMRASTCTMKKSSQDSVGRQKKTTAKWWTYLYMIRFLKMRVKKVEAMWTKFIGKELNVSPLESIKVGRTFILWKRDTANVSVSQTAVYMAMDPIQRTTEFSFQFSTNSRPVFNLTTGVPSTMSRTTQVVQVEPAGYAEGEDYGVVGRVALFRSVN